MSDSKNLDGGSGQSINDAKRKYPQEHPADIRLPLDTKAEWMFENSNHDLIRFLKITGAKPRSA